MDDRAQLSGLAELHRLRPAADYDPTAALRISRTANAIADALIRPEWCLLRAGATLPVGGSLMIVARRPSSS
jgi:hypothetical protein